MIKYIIIWCAYLMIPYGEGETIDPKDVADIEGVPHRISRNCRNQFVAENRAQKDSLLLFLHQSGADAIKVDSVIVEN